MFHNVVFHKRVWDTRTNKVQRDKNKVKESDTAQWRWYCSPLRSIISCSVWSPEVDPLPHSHTENRTKRQNRQRNALSLFWALVGVREAFQAEQHYPKERIQTQSKTFRNIFQQRINLLHNIFDRQTVDLPWAEHSSFTELCFYLLPHLYRPAVIHLVLQLQPGDVTIHLLTPLMRHVHSDVQTGVFSSRGCFFFWKGCRSTQPHCVVFLPELLKRSIRFKRFDLCWQIWREGAACCPLLRLKKHRNPHTSLREEGRATHVHICIQSIIINE